MEANKKNVNFLGVTRDFSTEKFKPCSKPTTNPLYVHRNKSNHPPNIIRNIPEAISRRLCDISSDEDVFNEAALPYQEALRKSGYSYNLMFNPAPERPPNQTRRQRNVNVIWFNPPLNRNVQTGRVFIHPIDRCFPTGHKLRKKLNRNTIKLSYSCMPNMKEVKDGCNKTILKKTAQPEQEQPPKDRQANTQT